MATIVSEPPGGSGGAVESKGLKAGALGLASATVVGVASTAPAYSLAASLGLVTFYVGTKAPAVMWIAFIPMGCIAAAFFYLAVRNLAPQRWLLRLALWSIPLPWVAAELGWIVAEYGRQPWTISEVLPTYLSVSKLSVSDVWASLGAFVAFYSVLLIIEIYLLLKYIRLGPSSLHTGKYDLELAGSGAAPAA